MFSLAISSIRSRWRPSSRPMIAATSGSASSRLSCQKRCSGSVSAWNEAELIGSGVLRKLRQLGNAPDMPVAAERGGEERLDATLGQLDAHDPGAEGDHVGVVMLAREAGRHRLAHPCAADGRVAIDRDRNANARAAQRHTALGFPGGDMLGELVAEVRII